MQRANDHRECIYRRPSATRERVRKKLVLRKSRLPFELFKNAGGEKQRLAFARLLLHNPDIVVLDEATSALDEKSQDKMMEIVIRELPKATIVSVAHRVELEAFHRRFIW